MAEMMAAADLAASVMIKHDSWWFPEANTQDL